MELLAFSFKTIRLFPKRESSIFLVEESNSAIRKLNALNKTATDEVEAKLKEVEAEFAETEVEDLFVVPPSGGIPPEGGTTNPVYQTDHNAPVA